MAPVSFKVSKTGTRYRPKLKMSISVDMSKYSENDLLADSKSTNNQGNFGGIRDKKTGDQENVFSKSLSGQPSVLEGHIEVSFALSLFPNGFSIGSATQGFNIIPKQLLPYNRESEKLFNAIENGMFPGDLFDEIPCKYVNGAILCEVRDYRNCNLVQRAGSISLERSPIVHKVILKLCIENVLKDILLTSDSSWTYGDILDAESRILRALQPNLNLNPKPLLNQFSGERKTRKLNLGIFQWRKRRKLTNASQMLQEFNNSNQILKSQSSPIDQARGRSSSQQRSSSSIPNLKENNEVLWINSQSTSLAIEPLCNRYIPSDMTYYYNKVPVPLEFSGIYNVPGEAGPIPRKPKNEQIDFSQLPRSRVGNNLEHELLWKNNLLHLLPEAQKSVLERLLDNGVSCISPSTTHNRLGISQDGLNIKQVPAIRNTSLPSNMETLTNSSNLARVNLSLPLDSGDKVALQRLLKIQEVSARHRLNEIKIRMDIMFPRKQFPRAPLVDSNLFSFVNHGSLEDPITDTQRIINVLKLRIITFLRPSRSQRGKGSSKISSVLKIKLLMLEKINEGIVEAGVLYVNEHKPDTIGFTSQQLFPGIISADLFASQFTSLIMKEGFFIANDQIEPLELNASGNSACQHQLTGGANLYQVLSSMTANILADRLLPSQSKSCGSHPLPSASVHPFFQLIDNNFPISQLHSTTTESFQMDPQWQQILNMRAQSQFQMLQRQRHRKELMKRKSLGGYSRQNFGPIITMPQVEILPWIGGTLLQRSIGMASMQPPTIPDMAYLLNNQQQLRAQMRQQVQQQPEKSLLLDQSAEIVDKTNVDQSFLVTTRI